MLVTFTCPLVLPLEPAAAQDGDAPKRPASAPAQVVELGKKLFTEETFGGNGRVCNTCHDLERFGTITPESVRQLFEADPKAPLFRSIDSDGGLGLSYERLQRHATIRVPIELPTRTASGLGIRLCDDPARTKLFLQRGNPSVFNVALDQHLMHDGRDGADLERQALNAVRAHNEPGREPTAEELEAIAAFQSSLFSHAGIKRLLRPDPGLVEAADDLPLRLPEGNTPSEKRGRAFFAPDRQCGQCHSGPMLNRTSRFHPFAIGAAVEGSAGDTVEGANEKLHWCYVDLESGELASGPAGKPEVFPTPVSDPGIGLVSGFQEFALPDGTPLLTPNEILVGVAGPLFKIPTLWGTPDTAPYFHDNSAKTLADVLDRYNRFFASVPDGTVLGCDPHAPPCLSDEDKEDILDFMRLLSFERMASPAQRPDLEALHPAG